MKCKLIIFLIAISIQVIAQDDDTKSKFEVGLNVTSVLSSFSGNGDFLEASDFPFNFKVGTTKRKVRVGLGFSGNSNNFIDSVTGALRRSTFQNYFFRAGLENYFKSETKWHLYWGFDFIGSLVNEKIEVVNFGDSISSNEIGFGGGPLLGIMFQINDKLYLSSESTLYAIYRTKTLSEDISPIETTTIGWDFTLTPPLFLFLNYRF